ITGCSSHSLRLYLHHLRCFSFFFFFQAEDGIRDYKVTGVQTCALPILQAVERRGQPLLSRCIWQEISRQLLAQKLVVRKISVERSEERRVGKECRSRWWTYH